jgi:hypothetical protein
MLRKPVPPDDLLATVRPSLAKVLRRDFGINNARNS